MKPKFGREFAKCLLVVLIIGFLIDMTFTYQAGEYYVNKCINGIDEYADINIAKGIDKMHEYGINKLDYVDIVDGKAVINISDSNQMDAARRAYMAVNFKAHYPSTLYCAGDGFYSSVDYARQILGVLQGNRPQPYYFGALYDMEGEEISSQEKDGFLIYSMTDETGMTSSERKVYLYSLDKMAIEKAYPGLIDELSDVMWSGHYYNEMRMNDVYIDESGLYVLPKSIDIVYSGGEDYFGNTSTDIEEETLIKSYDLSGCDFTGYTPAPEVNDDIRRLGPVFIDDSVGSYHYEAYKEIKDTEEFKNALQTVVDGDGNANEYYRSDFKVYGYIIEKVGSSGTIAVTFIDGNLFRDWLPVLLIVYIFTALVGVVASVIIAKSKYNRKHMAYELDSYRRKTTNAMAHDLKSPLMAISGYAENINKNTNPEKAEYYARNILDTVSDMDKMIVGILELAKMEEMVDKLSMTTIEVSDVVKAQLEKYDTKITKKGLSINNIGSANISANKECMEHLIDNLISNAVKYSLDNSQIDIKISDKELVISNEMAGNIAVPVDQLTEQFVKGDNARSNTEGNGLGLSIVKNAVQMQGYEMDIEINNKIFSVKISF